MNIYKNDKFISYYFICAIKKILNSVLKKSKISYSNLKNSSIPPKIKTNLCDFNNNTNNIEAVHDKDIEKFLKSLNEYEKLIDNKIFCCVCNQLITLKNIQSIFSKNGTIHYCCIKDNCFNKVNTAERK